VLDKNRLRSAVRVDNAVFARKFVGVPCFLLEGAGNEDEFDRCVRDAGADALTTAKKEADEADAARKKAALSLLVNPEQKKAAD
jgi:hypothetical protein